MAATMPPTEPSNAEIKSILESLRAEMSATAREQAAAMGELKSEVSAVRAKVHEIEGRVHRVESENKRLRDSHAELEGGLLREVGALAANDRAQNKKLTDIESETKKQSEALVKLESETKKQTEVLSEIVAYKQAIKKYAKWTIAAVLAAPKVWALLELVYAHVKF